MAGEFLGALDHHQLAAPLAHRNFVARRDLERRDIHLASVHRDMAVAHQLARLTTAGAKAHAIDDVIQAALQLLQKRFAGDAFLGRSLFEIVAKLLFQREVDALGLLLLAQLQAVANDFGLAIFAVLAGSEVTLFHRALFTKTLGALEKKLHAFAAAKAANGTGITSHLFSPHRVCDRFTGWRPFVPIGISFLVSGFSFLEKTGNKISTPCGA